MCSIAAKVQHTVEADGMKKSGPTWGRGGGCIRWNTCAVMRGFCLSRGEPAGWGRGGGGRTPADRVGVRKSTGQGRVGWGLRLGRQARSFCRELLSERQQGSVPRVGSGTPQSCWWRSVPVVLFFHNDGALCLWMSAECTAVWNNDQTSRLSNSAPRYRPKVNEKTCTQIFKAALLKIAPNWKQPKCSSTRTGVNRLWWKTTEH